MKKLHQYFKELFKTYSLFFKSAPILATVVLLLAPLQAIFSLITIYASQEVINEVTSNHSFLKALVIWIVSMGLLQILPSISTAIQGALTDKLTGFINLNLMKKSSNLQSLSIFDNNEYFDELQMLRSDASWRPVNLIVFGVSVLQSFLTLVFMLIYLSKYNWLIALMLIIVMIPQSLTYYHIQQESFETMVERSKNSRYLHYYSSLLLDRRDAKEVRLFNFFPKIITNYIKLFDETKRDVNKIRRKQVNISLIFMVLVISVLGYGFFWFANSVAQEVLQAGVLLMFVSITSYISSSMARLVEDSSLLYDSLLWIEKYFNFLQYDDGFENGSISFPTNFKKLDVHNLSFTYPFSKDEVLHDLNFSVHKGEKIAIVGENGSGKSTLIKLLMRFYDPSQGEIEINGQNMKDINIHSLHDNMSATFQNYSKFKLSLADNVVTGHSYDEQRLENSLKKAGLEKLLLNKHINFQTILAKEFKDGIDLSGGQWQKIALARDMYSNGEIEFLDEPTASLDAKSEAEIYERFLRENHHKTIFFVTHRLSAVKFADKVLFLNNGRITGFDTHQQLLKNNATYAEMYGLQKNAYI